MARAGLSGVAVGMVSTGAYLAYAGIKDVGLLDGLRSLIRGQVPVSKAPVRGGADLSFAVGAPGSLAFGPDVRAGLAAAAGTGTGAQLVAAARRYIGVPYRWGGRSAAGLDCSGLVWLAFHDIGISAPATSALQAAWPQLRKVSRDQLAAGDLTWWPGHIGIAVNASQGIYAPRPGRVVQIETVDLAGPTSGPPLLCLRYVGGVSTIRGKVMPP